ncbi:hypothetical protein O0L34_g11279 [Tuta absoluta]|nr:hypothetical protein O0L34_g11279 [Tuta absoluta]
MLCFVTYLVLLCGIPACKAAVVTFIQQGGDGNVTTNLDNCTVLLNYLNRTRVTLLFTPGVNSSIGGRYITAMIEAHILTHNVILLDWTAEARILFGIAALSYAVSNAPSAEKIGYEFGECLVALIKNGLGDYLIMGHSLGAHLMGAAGRRAKELNCPLKSIIALDPSTSSLITVRHPIDSTCAGYVMAIHTDPNGYGDTKAICTVDIFPNHDPIYTMQPGCTQKANYGTINENTTCSHDFAWKLIIASRFYSNLLIAQGASSGLAWQCGRGYGTVAYITVEVQPGVTGQFYLRTTATYPYGLGVPGMYPNNSTCPTLV